MAGGSCPTGAGERGGPRLPCPGHERLVLPAVSAPRSVTARQPCAGRHDVPHVRAHHGSAKSREQHLTATLERPGHGEVGVLGSRKGFARLAHILIEAAQQSIGGLKAVAWGSQQIQLGVEQSPNGKIARTAAPEHAPPGATVLSSRESGLALFLRLPPRALGRQRHDARL